MKAQVSDLISNFVLQRAAEIVQKSIGLLDKAEEKNRFETSKDKNRSVLIIPLPVLVLSKKLKIGDLHLAQDIKEDGFKTILFIISFEIKNHLAKNL